MNYWIAVKVSDFGYELRDGYGCMQQFLAGNMEQHLELLFTMGWELAAITPSDNWIFKRIR